MSGKDRIEELALKADDVFGSLDCISLMGNVGNFKEWITKEHPEVSLDEVFPGYKFAVETSIRTLINNLETDSSLNVEEDFIFFRARFKGIEINKVPNTCDKTALIKNINSYIRALRKAKDWEETDSVLKNFDQKVGSIFREIYKNHIEVPSKIGIPKDDALKYSAMFMANTFLVNGSRGIPQGFSTSTISYNLRNEEELKEALFGYKYALQFLWATFLGDRYSSTPLVNLHKTTEWCIDDDVFDVAFNNEEEPDIGPKENYLDSYYIIIHEKILDPIEKEFKINFAFSKILYVSKPIQKSAFGDLLIPPQEPHPSEKEKLDIMMLWYQIELLDSSSKIFTGVPALLSMLAGAVETKRIFAGGEKVQVRRFVHHDPSVNGNDYSYAVLIEARGSSGISDYSGWELFYDCCGDYSGFSGSQHAMIEGMIETYLKKGTIELQEYTIGKEKFKEYIANEIAEDKQDFLFEEEQKEALQELEKSEEKTKKKIIEAEEQGIVHELITYYTLTKTRDGDVDWKVDSSDGEIDLTIETSDTFRLIECIVDPYTKNIEREINTLKKKLNINKTTKEKRCQFWFILPPSPQDLDKLKKAYENNPEFETHEIIADYLKEGKIIWDNQKLKVEKLKTIYPKLRDYLNGRSRL